MSWERNTEEERGETMVIYINLNINIYIYISRKSSHPQRWHLCNMPVFMHRPEYMADTDEIQTYHFLPFELGDTPYVILGAVTFVPS